MERLTHFIAVGIEGRGQQAAEPPSEPVVFLRHALLLAETAADKLPDRTVVLQRHSFVGRVAHSHGLRILP
jgi:hypothetical protein